MIKWISLVASWLFRIYIETICFRMRALGPNVDPRRKDLKQRFIYAFFHENALLPCFQFASPNIHVLISQHADGEMVAGVCRHLGVPTIRGSSTRGGVEATRKMVRAGRHCHIVVIPDGPRGPRRHVEPGLIFLASRTQLPIVVAGIGYRNPWRLPTWDRFAIPRPFSEALILTADPIVIPADLDKAQLEPHRAAVEAALVQLTERAERVVNRGRTPFDHISPSR